jgi:hypothetical protein
MGFGWIGAISGRASLRTGAILRRTAKAVVMVAIFALFGMPVISAEAAARKNAAQTNEWASVPEVPGDEIFGFTSPTDVGNVGEFGLANEFDGRLGKRGGHYGGYNSKSEFGYTFADDWWIGASPFGAWNNIRNVGGLADTSTSAFDGLSFELQYRLLRRSAGNPLAISLAVEPRWARIDSTSGLRSDAYYADFKFLIDAVIMPDQLYWAANAYFTPQRAQDIVDRNIWLNSSSTFLSTALTFQLSPSIFVGVEARHIASYNGTWLNERAGYAVYVGPTLAWKITEKIVFNTTWQPQVSGRSVANPGLRYDLDNFERSQFRVKLSLGLN